MKLYLMKQYNTIKKNGLNEFTGYTLDFNTFKEFQQRLKQQVRHVLKGTTPDLFFRNCDAPYHIRPGIQTVIIGEMQNFLQVFIENLKNKMPNQISTLQQGVADSRREPPKWYVEIGDERIHYSDDINEKLNLADMFSQHVEDTIHGQHYRIDPKTMTQTNTRTNITRKIGKVGGKSKRKSKRRKYKLFKIEPY